MIIFLLVLIAFSLSALGAAGLLLRLNSSRNRLLPIIGMSCVSLLLVLFWFDRHAALFTEVGPQPQTPSIEVSQP